MPRPRRNNNLRDQLLVEGYNAFLHNGYHGTGLKEVLDRLRIPKGSFYNYFESKEAIAFAAEGSARQEPYSSRWAFAPPRVDP